MNKQLSNSTSKHDTSSKNKSSVVTLSVTSTGSAKSTNMQDEQISSTSSIQLSNDLNALAESIFAKIRSKDKALPKETNTSLSSTVPDWKVWWDNIPTNSEDKVVLEAGIKSILTGAYTMASQRIYDTAIRKLTVKSTNTTTSSSNSGSNIQKQNHQQNKNTKAMSGNSSNGKSYESNRRQRDDGSRNNNTNHVLYPPERRNNNSIPSMKPYDHHYNNNYYQNHRHDHYHDNTNRSFSFHDRAPFYLGDENYYRDNGVGGRSGSHHGSNRDSEYHRRITENPPPYNDSRSLGSNGVQHYDRRQLHRKKDEVIDNDHRSLASSISTKPQNGLPPPHHPSSYSYNKEHRHQHRSHYDDYYEPQRDIYHREHRRRQRRNSSSSSSRSDSISDSKQKDQHRNRRSQSMPFDDHEHKRYRSRRDDYSEISNKNEYYSRGRRRSRSPTHRRDYDVRPDGNRYNDNGHDDRHHRHSDAIQNRQFDRRNTRSPTAGSDKMQEINVISEGKDAKLPVVEVTTNVASEKSNKKRDRRHSTPSPRKSRKSKRHKSSSRNKSGSISDSDSFSSSSTSSTSSGYRRSEHRRHGSSSNRKQRRSTSKDDTKHSTSASPRKRSGRKHRKNRRRNRTERDNDVENSGTRSQESEVIEENNPSSIK